jgi:hypothetical protein
LRIQLEEDSLRRQPGIARSRGCDDEIRKTLLMTTAKSTEHHDFDLAFELAYCIHINKEIAFFVAEDALDELPLLLGYQDKNRRPSEYLSGFWKWGERTRPIRKTVRLTEQQMLQWLVYKQSEQWERQTERGNELYLPTQEDMIVRYLEHLVFSTLRRGSFYVTLAVGQLLHQFDRRETRLFYDILTQSDSSRMKDMGYIGKQRLELLGRICQRFPRVIQTTKIPGGEKQFVMQPTTQSVISLVQECLRRFTPWETSCVITQGFDVTDIPEFYFSGTDGGDEDHIEMNRIHTLLDPDCFARFVAGLDSYVRILPVDNQDKGCNYHSANPLLSVPQFDTISDRPPRGDRFHPPPLTKEDYIRLQRTIESRTRRRKALSSPQLSVYVDQLLLHSFETKQIKRSQFLIGPDVEVIEVRGRDAVGELPLAILLVEDGRIAAGEAYKDSIVHTGGQKVEVQLTPVLNAQGKVEGAQLAVCYVETRFIQSLFNLVEQAWLALGRLAKRARNLWQDQGAGFSWLAKTIVAVIVILAALLFIWWRLQSSYRPSLPPQQAEQPPTDDKKPDSPVVPQTPPEAPQNQKKAELLIARAAWSSDPQTALSAIPIEPTRGEGKTIDLSRRQTELFLNLPVYDTAGRKYSRYRIILVTTEKSIWQQALRAPVISLTGNAHILNVTLFSKQLPSSGSYEVRVEGFNQRGWQVLGHLLLNPMAR